MGAQPPHIIIQIRDVMEQYSQDENNGKKKLLVPLILLLLCVASAVGAGYALSSNIFMNDNNPDTAEISLTVVGEGPAFTTGGGEILVDFVQDTEYNLDENPIEKLTEIYVRISNLCKEDETVLEACRDNFKKLEEKDPYCLEIWNKFRKLSLKEFQKVYDMLGSKFDSWNGEAFYSDKMQEIIQKLESTGKLVESQGARIIDLEDYGMAPCLIEKSNGSSTYATRDLAAILYRARTYDYDKALYVTSYEQVLHFRQIFEVAKLLGLDEKYIKGYLHKDEKCNKVTVQETETSGALPIETRYRPLGDNGTVTLLEVELITGRTHQIRAHLAGTDHPLIGDYKYGRRTLNDEYRRKYGLKSQLLHAYRLEIPEIEGRLSYLSGKEFTAPLPYLFQKILKEEHVEENK